VVLLAQYEKSRQWVVLPEQTRARHWWTTVRSQHLQELRKGCAICHVSGSWEWGAMCHLELFAWIHECGGYYPSAICWKNL